MPPVPGRSGPRLLHTTTKALQAAAEPSAERGRVGCRVPNAERTRGRVGKAPSAFPAEGTLRPPELPTAAGTGDRQRPGRAGHGGADAHWRGQIALLPTSGARPRRRHPGHLAPDRPDEGPGGCAPGAGDRRPLPQQFAQFRRGAARPGGDASRQGKAALRSAGASRLRGLRAVPRTDPGGAGGGGRGPLHLPVGS